MSQNQFERTERVIGKSSVEKLKTKKVAIFGLGGVGGFTAEALARSGIGYFDLIDKDEINETNLNRQIIALHSTLGKTKVSVMKQRILDINPNAVVNEREVFFLPENSEAFDFSKYDYVVDAVDNVTAKIEIISLCKKNAVPVISSMGTGNKLNPSLLKISEISKTSVCPLARIMRKELAKRGINDIKCVYSEEKPVKSPDGLNVIGSVAFVPSVAGLLIASEVIKDLIK